MVFVISPTFGLLDFGVCFRPSERCVGGAGLSPPFFFGPSAMPPFQCFAAMRQNRLTVVAGAMLGRAREAGHTHNARDVIPLFTAGRIIGNSAGRFIGFHAAQVK